MDYIKLIAVGQNRAKMNFCLKVNTKLKKLKKAYSERMDVPLGALRFLYDGRRIKDDDTPQTLQMETNQIIEVYYEQLGGAYGSE
ncbi:Small ubiquitin-related modifier [Orchesella cincta]|uniref:Small ubiquitin-related modifier n=1 Tax=Orchesella cincta TaxID=48709 RepID=A0A1D2NFX6_ORCCI|nr:Small ubiquitin-related modifier [Orchesella cincta]